MLFLLVKQFGNRLFFSCRSLRHVVAALLFEIKIERAKVLEFRHRHEMLASRVADRVFHMSFFLRLANATEMMLEKKMRRDAEKLASRFRTATTDDLANGDFRVVKLDQRRYATEKQEGPFQTLLETLRAFDRKHLKITHVAVRK